MKTFARGLQHEGNRDLESQLEKGIQTRQIFVLSWVRGTRAKIQRHTHQVSKYLKPNSEAAAAAAKSLQS